MQSLLVQTFFTTITEKDVNNNDVFKQIECKIINWIWDCIFNNFTLYLELQKQLNENYYLQILNAKDIQTVQNMKFVFSLPLSIDVSEIIQILQQQATISLNGIDVAIPSFVKNAISKINREIFKEVNISSLIENQDIKLNNGLLN